MDGIHKAKKFEEIYIENFSSVFRYVRRHIASKEEAEDLTAEVFTAVWKHWNNFDDTRCPAKAWLYIAASNRLKNYYRDHEDYISFEEAYMSDGECDIECVSDALRLMNIRSQIHDALVILTERERKIVVDKYLIGKEYSEIAIQMDITEVNVRVIASRALKKMRNYLNESEK